jgi:hypothetical protein
MLHKMLQAMEDGANYALHYQFQKEMMKQQLLDREERQKLIDDVCEAVLPRISIQIKAEAISQPRDLILGLGGKA